jgi:hypothetical protein
MGLYFNTKTTTEMQQKVNDQFTGDPMKWWQQFSHRKWFAKNGHHFPQSPLRTGLCLLILQNMAAGKIGWTSLKTQRVPK